MKDFEIMFDDLNVLFFYPVAVICSLYPDAPAIPV